MIYTVPDRSLALIHERSFLHMNLKLLLVACFLFRHLYCISHFPFQGFIMTLSCMLFK